MRLVLHLSGFLRVTPDWLLLHMGLSLVRVAPVHVHVHVLRHHLILNGVNGLIRMHLILLEHVLKNVRRMILVGLLRLLYVLLLGLERVRRLLYGFIGHHVQWRLISHHV